MALSPQTAIHPVTSAAQSWSGRPRLALIVKLFASLAPLALSVFVTAAVARLWAGPSAFPTRIVWWLCLLSIGTAVLLAADRLARRLLPLAALLKMSLIFPDQAPSRFGVALRNPTTKQLERRMHELRASGLSSDESVAAGELLELVAALSRHDRFTRGHGERVRAYSSMIGEEMGLGAQDLSKLRWAGLIHDVGKVDVPVEILTKAGRLTNEEYEIIKTHPAAGDRLIEPLREWLGEWADVVGQHHERIDGKGYPAGLSGTEISLGARIVAVADTFDVMTAARSYKKPQAPQVARQELARCAGTQFDEEVVRAFLNISIGRLRREMGPLSWFAALPYLAGAAAAPALNAAAVIAFATTSVAATSLPPQEATDVAPPAGIETSLQEGVAGRATSTSIAQTTSSPDGTPNGSTVTTPASTMEIPVPTSVGSTSIPLPTMPTIPGVGPGLTVPTLPAIELPGIELPLPDLPPITVQLPELPLVELPIVELPAVELPPVTTPTVTVPTTLPEVTLPPLTLPGGLW